MFSVGELVDGKFRVDRLCSESGGMGGIFHVSQLHHPPHFPLVLKYCKSGDSELRTRFRREVRLLNSFQGNLKVAQIWDQNLDLNPPYFVMRFYPDGDLTTLHSDLRNSPPLQESVFLQMIACIQELHSRNQFHRDIKPQNFLRSGAEIVVSDLGLSTELSSVTNFTSSSASWGTPGYTPPEFHEGGFKNPDAAADIYMLGKTFYVLLTNRQPAHLIQDDLAGPVFHVIERCCSVSKLGRYQTLSELKQALVACYDVLLGRAGGVLQGLFSSMRDRFANSSQYVPEEVANFVDQLALSSVQEHRQIYLELPNGFFSAISESPLTRSLPVFLRMYEAFVEDGEFAFSHAEDIATRMNYIFRATSVAPQIRAYALDLAVIASINMNRFAAMHTCEGMVRSISEQSLAMEVVRVLFKHQSTFLADLDPSSCQNETIRNAIKTIRSQQSSEVLPES